MSPAGVNIRVATEADAAGIARAHVRAWQIGYADVMPAEFLAGIDVDDRTDQWAANLRGDRRVDAPVGLPVNLVAEGEDDEIVGFACYGEYRDEPTADVGEVWAIYVDPDHWSTGAGHLLISNAEQRLVAAGAEEAHLWVLRDNPRARRFYEAHGWVLSEAVKNFEIAGVALAEVRYTKAFSPEVESG